MCSFHALLLEMVEEELVMFLAVVVMMRRERNAENRNFGLQLHLHHAVDDGSSHKIMTINTAVNHECSTNDCRIATGLGERFGMKWNFISAENIEDFNFDIGAGLGFQFSNEALTASSTMSACQRT